MYGQINCWWLSKEKNVSSEISGFEGVTLHTLPCGKQGKVCKVTPLTKEILGYRQASFCSLLFILNTASYIYNQA